jgi:Reverse transcriptase (RNA-dependent DNA polymerase)
MEIIDHYIKHPILATLVLKALRRTETLGGNFYDYYQKGITKRCPLSPLLSAIALMPLDQAMGEIKDVFYTRFVDDWIVLTKSKTMLRKIIKKTHNLLNKLHLTMHPNKTYIGKIKKGFNFLGYFYQPSTLLPSLESIRRCHERSAVRYAQVSQRRRISAPNRDTSDYQVNERAPTDEDMVRVLCSLSWQLHQNPERQTQLQRYLQRWGCWFKSGLTEVDAFMASVQVSLPSLSLILDKHDIHSIILAHVN